ncbi:hypothetical protein [Hyphomicrobium sp.]|uniref:hypothetical protein n=1 Tax=Hyphomicrobium sp. TaxID=82 RepID=UPI0025BE5837|nr:hypothetical protein [Hyphomicrobium sp.]
MGIKSIALCAVAASILSATSASAITLGAPAPVAASTAIQQVDYRNDHRNSYRKKYYHKRHDRHPPKGWHRYHKRPGDWSRRGCMAIGPVWWCP